MKIKIRVNSDRLLTESCSPVDPGEIRLAVGAKGNIKPQEKGAGQLLRNRQKHTKNGIRKHAYANNKDK